MIRFIAYGTARPAPRPRAVRTRGGVIRVYHPSSDAEWRRAIAVCASMHRPPSPIDGPVGVDIDFRICPYRSRRTRKRIDGGWYASRPDIDNLIKPVLDELSRAGYWRDDAQVVCVTARKVRVAEPHDAGAAITVFEVDQAP